MAWPARNRFLDFIIAGFYALAFLIIYLIEIEQLIIVSPEDFNYPLWPPAPLIDLTHWWGENYHGTLYHRPAWYRATIWIDVFISGPVYAFGYYAFIKQKAWIKYPALIQASMLIAIVLISMVEEIHGIYSGDQQAIVLVSMTPWILVPLIIVYRAIEIKPG